MARAIADRVGGDPGYPGLTSPLTIPPPRRPTRLALLRTAGWPILAAPARTSLEAALDRLRAAGVAVLTPDDCDALAAVEAATAEAQQITMGINAWERRWPLGSFVVARCFSAEPERAGTACTGAGDDAGGLCGAAGQA
jgi:hypothetical protein